MGKWDIEPPALNISRNYFVQIYVGFYQRSVVFRFTIFALANMVQTPVNIW